ncbi:myristylated tegument protein [Equid alphaherpesvirus 4]|uniref:51 n=2 Tax=Equid alphaherpesvirus 4 TaxID=10331 RepID=A0A288CG42_EHV4|nr:myristylated tegument protein [Equid alphaherpesvirus 4]AAC59569.1 51 [Equid alphaherpesvirus 4]AMB15935.1 myristylated tegument protein [Equid alphaherpesvirus 4]AMB16014.1 myristylated tegument protein [Equid alphaherpesvirus 4]AMB16093.1 myristylated tegument protein [Equid alphaherpesvirus 4]AMB16172.1 myristylated tegument protein [Equid alphaherpesvirus 4]
MGQRLSCGCFRTNQLVTHSGEIVSLNADTFEEFSMDEFDIPPAPPRPVFKQPSPYKQPNPAKVQRNLSSKRRDPY